jgi:hypothetical protein
MTLNEIFPDSGKFMEWLANNCYSCVKLPDDPKEYNSRCELEPIISYADLDEEIDEKLVRMITENGKLCKCKNLNRVLFFSPERTRAWRARSEVNACAELC